MAYEFDLFVIGGGSAGVRCGRIAAGHGARVAVAEERFWGGTCVNVGCIPKKLLVQAAEYGAWADDARGFGWEIDKRGHDWAALIAAKDREIGRLNEVYRKLLDGAGATVFDAHTRFVDAHCLDVGGRRITAERIVIATGGHPQRPAIPGAELSIVSDDAFFLPERPRRVLVYGGGYIAAEFAGIFQGLGAQVEMVYRQPLPLRGFDRDLREALADALAAQGVHLHAGTTVEAIEADGATRRAMLANGATIATDLVFFAIGRRPNVAGLGLENAGVALNRAGAIPVDAEMRTSQPHIYAIGDVTDRLNLTPVATAEGHALADRLFGPGPRTWNFDQVPTAVFSTPPLATVGLTEEQAAKRGPVDIYVAKFKPLRHNLTGRNRWTLMKLVVDDASQRVLGAHMLGDDAPEIVQGLAIALTCGATKSDLDRTVGIHPTAAEEFVTMRTRTRVAGVARAAE
ncbi:MAG: glutathione-disulfide reductase [Alphaproteobacteria bacterium]|nr:glutathione-disulfide reductase [Alphaproteobacteria bacterium]